VDAYFQEVATYWAEIYERDGVNEIVHQERRRSVINLVDSIQLPQDAKVLEVGSGAGSTAVALAKRGLCVEAIDAAPAMVDLTRKLAAQAGVENKLQGSLGDVCDLSYPDESFSLILAIGVLPWLPALERPIREMCRVLRNGGSLIITIDNRWGLRWLFDPLTNPLLKPLKEATKQALRPLRQPKSGVRSHLNSRRECDALLRAIGFDQVSFKTLGFGPFTVFNFEILPRSFGLKTHCALQDLADRGFPALRWAGSQYIVLARKRTSTVPESTS
jgi:ubiquinone/menaquinone biosynthesis C-methylase UbiE